MASDTNDPLLKKSTGMAVGHRRVERHRPRAFPVRRAREFRFITALLAAAALAACAPATVQAPAGDAAHVRARPLAAPHAKILFSNAEGFFFTGRYDEAVKEYAKVIAIEPAHPDAWRCRAAAHATLGREAEALADYGRAVALAPNDDEVWLGRGLWHFARGRYAEAIEDFDRSIALDPRHAIPFKYKALACEKIGRIREANEARAAYIHCSVKVEEAQGPAERPAARELKALGLE